MVKRLIFILMCGLLHAPMLFAAQLKAAVDAAEHKSGEPVVFTLSLIDSDTRLRAEGVDPNVDLTVLTKDFDIGTPSVENTYNIYKGRGRSTSKLSVELFPKHAGLLTIPAFGVEGLRTAPIKLHITAAQTGKQPEVFVRTGIDKKTVWAHEQIYVYADLFVRTRLKSASMGDTLTTEPAQIDLMESRNLRQTERREKYQGAIYQVTRAAWAIFPHQAGDLTIYLPDIWVETAAGEKLRFPHHAENVKVRALPAGAPADLLIGKPGLSQSTPDTLPEVNGFTSWTITLRSTSAASTLPETLPIPAQDRQFKLYLDRADRQAEETPEGITNIARYTLSVIPLMAGTFDMPRAVVPYLDTDTGRIETAELPKLSLTVKEGAAGPAAGAGTGNLPADHQTTTPSTQDHTKNPALPWQIATSFLALAWLGTLSLWLRKRKQSGLAPAPAISAPKAASPLPAHPLQARLLETFASRSLEEGLQQWESRHGIDDAVRTAVRAIQQLRYGKDKQHDDAQLHAMVEQAVATIRAAQTRIMPQQPDPWSPRTFSRKTD